MFPKNLHQTEQFSVGPLSVRFRASLHPKSLAASHPEQSCDLHSRLDRGMKYVVGDVDAPDSVSAMHTLTRGVIHNPISSEAVKEIAMSTCRFVVSMLLLGTVLCAAAVAQRPVPPVRSGGPAPWKNRQEPCWQVAGISQSAMQQVRTTRQQARQEMEAVCANSSLSLQQKREQLREIRQKERQQVATLITPQQEQARRACQQERGMGGHAGGGGGRGTGPCGEMPTGKKAEPQAEQKD